MNSAPFLVWFADIDTHATSAIGKAGKQLGALTQAGFPIMPGFVVTTNAYKHFLEKNKLPKKIQQLLTTVNYDRPESVHQVTQHVKKMVAETTLPEELQKDLQTFYKKVQNHTVIVHAHTTRPEHKFAEQAVESFDELLEQVKSSWVQHFEPMIHHKRHIHGHDHIDAGVELIVQVHIKPDKKGKVHTVDPQEHTKNILTITHEHPHATDTYMLSKKSLMIMDRSLTHHANAEKLTHDELLTIANVGRDLELHLYFPQEITWGIIDDNVFLLHTKPLSTLPKSKPIPKKKIPHARGISLAKHITSGVVRVVLSESELNKATSHDIVIIHSVDKAHVKDLKRVRGVISETGKRHAEITTLLRQLGIPVMLGVKDATKHFKNGRIITINATKGEIYLGGHH